MTLGRFSRAPRALGDTPRMLGDTPRMLGGALRALGRRAVDCGDAEVPPALVLMAKLVALALLLSGVVEQLPEPFLAFIPPLDALPAPDLVRRGLQIAFVAAVAWVLVGRRPRAAALALGLVLLFALATSRLFYSSNRVYAAMVLVLVGLHEPRLGLGPLRFQLWLLYAGAAVDKLLEPVWRSGDFMALWLPAVAGRFFSVATAWLPEALVTRGLGWATILGELALAVGFALPRLRAAAAAAGALFHIGLLVLTGQTFSAFFGSALASYLAVVSWPPRAPAGTPDGGAAGAPASSGAGAPAFSGPRTLRERALANPAFFLVAAVLIQAHVGSGRLRGVLALALWCWLVLPGLPRGTPRHPPPRAPEPG